MARAYWCCYYSYRELFEHLTDECLGKLFSAILDYCETGEIPTEIPDSSFWLIKSQIDRDSKKYDEICVKRKESISKRWSVDTKVNKSIQENTNVYKCIQSDTKDTKKKEKEKEKDKDKEIINKAVEPPVVSLILNDGSFYDVTLKDVEEFESLYPAVDVRNALLEMKDWCIKNNTKRKTRRGIRTFITFWLGKEQDRGGDREIPVRTNSNADVMRQMIMDGVFDE